MMTCFRLSVWLCLVSSACVQREVAQEDPDPNINEGARVPINIRPKGDILFIIDNSGSMKEEQTALRANFPIIIQELDKISQGRPDLHIAVTSTDVGMNLSGNCSGDGDNGRFNNTGPGCQGPSDGFIKDLADANGGRETNYGGTLEDTFSCIADLGTGGCGYEQPLEAMRRALAPTGQEVADQNAGFLRKDAVLAVVIITDEDDCSASNRAEITKLASDIKVSNIQCAKAAYDCVVDGTANWNSPGTNKTCKPRDDGPLYTVDEYVDFLRQLKSEQNGHTENTVVVAGVMGDLTADVSVVNRPEGSSDKYFVGASCSYNLGGATEPQEAAPSLRMSTFVESFARNTNETICTDDLTPAIAQIAELLRRNFEDSCIPSALDVSKCVAEFEAEAPAESFIIKQCSSEAAADAEAPCWYATANAANCKAGEQGFSVRMADGFDKRGYARLDCEIVE